MKYKQYCSILLIFLYTTLNASVYNYDTLNMFAKITPRFIFLSSVQNSIEKEIKLCIVSDDIETKEAVTITEYMKLQYPKGIKSTPFNIINISYKTLLTPSNTSCTNAQVLFFFDSTKENIEKSVDFSQHNSILTASYDAKLLEDGVDISLFIGRKIVPYVNIESIKEKGIVLDNIMLRLSKIFIKRSK